MASDTRPQPKTDSLIQRANLYAAPIAQDIPHYATLPAVQRLDILMAIKLAYVDGYIDALKEMVHNNDARSG